MVYIRLVSMDRKHLSDDIKLYDIVDHKTIEEAAGLVAARSHLLLRELYEDQLYQTFDIADTL